MSFFPLLFILRVRCKTLSLGEKYGSRRYVLIREHHWIIFSSRIFSLGSFSINFFYFLIYLSAFSHLQTLKIIFPPSIKGFQYLKRVWKHLFGSFHLYAHFLPSINHFRFLNLKIPKKLASDFNLLMFLPMDSTSTCHCSNLKISF